MASTDTSFRFVSIQTPDGETKCDNKRSARSHAIKQGLDRKRKRQQKSGLNFCVYCPKKGADQRDKVEQPDQAPLLPSEPLPNALEPLQMLAADSFELRRWLRNQDREIKHPLFDVTDELVFVNFRSIFRTSLHDPALLNAAMLTFSLAVSGTIDGDCLRYQSKAIQAIRARMSCPREAASESTIAAILLLAFVETRMIMFNRVQLHMNAVQQLLNLCQAQGVSLTDGIKRAVFWQDLNHSSQTGTWHRLCAHDTFPSLDWHRDPFTPQAFVLPAGFRPLLSSGPSNRLTPAFVEVLQDIHALQLIRESDAYSVDDEWAMGRIDSHQASIQARLVGMPRREEEGGGDAWLECCYGAAYLCSTMLRCRIWKTSVVPAHLSTQLLRNIQQQVDNPLWDLHPDLLLWLLLIGGGFSPVQEIKSQYVALFRMNEYRFRRHGSWEEAVEILRGFIWSDLAFLEHVRPFWEGIRSADAP